MNNPENQGLSANYGDEDIAAINNQWQNYSETVEKEVPFEPKSAEVEKSEKRVKAKSNLTRGLAFLLAAGIATAGIVGTVELTKAQSESLDRALEKNQKQVEAYEEEKAEYQATPAGQAEMELHAEWESQENQ